jgi:DNA-binding GntR family transcriptional regulator
LVTRRQKLGTTVTGPIVLPADQLMTVSEFSSGALSGNGPSHTTGTVIETAMIAAPRVIRERLGLEHDASVLVIEGVLLFDDTPVALSVSYVALPSGRDEVANIQTPDAVAFLEDHLDVCVTASATMLGAQPCDAQTAGLLLINEGDAILWCEDVLYDSAGTPRGLIHCKFRGDRVAMSATAHRRVVASDVADRSVQELHRAADRDM